MKWRTQSIGKHAVHRTRQRVVSVPLHHVQKVRLAVAFPILNKFSVFLLLPLQSTIFTTDIRQLRDKWKKKIHVRGDMLNIVY